MASLLLLPDMSVTVTGTVRAGAFNVNGSYLLPSSAGTAEGQVLRYVSGTTVAWASPHANYALRNTSDTAITIASTDGHVVCRASGAKTATLPLASSGKLSVTLHNTGGGGTLTVATQGPDTVRGATSFLIQNQYDSLTFTSNPDYNEWLVS